MSFREHIPDSVINFHNTSRFMDVLDGVLEDKESYVHRFGRYHNPALFTDPQWLVDRLAEFGFPGIPVDYPMDCLQLLLLNAGTILRLRGSKLGWILLINALTHANPDKYSDAIIPLADSGQSVDGVTYRAYTDSEPIVFPDALNGHGFITGDNSNMGNNLVGKLPDVRNSISMFFYAFIPNVAPGYIDRKNSFENLFFGSPVIRNDKSVQKRFWMDFIPTHNWDILQIDYSTVQVNSFSYHKLLNTYYR